MPKESKTGRAQARRYSKQQIEQAVRLVQQLRAELGTDCGTIKRVADQLGYGSETVRKWVNQADIDAGVGQGTTTTEAEWIKLWFPPSGRHIVSVDYAAAAAS